MLDEEIGVPWVRELARMHCRFDVRCGETGNRTRSPGAVELAHSAECRVGIPTAPGMGLEVPRAEVAEDLPVLRALGAIPGPCLHAERQEVLGHVTEIQIVGMTETPR